VPRLGLLPAPLPPSPAAATLPMSPPHALARRTGKILRLRRIAFTV